jgi:hypothetical protein
MADSEFVALTSQRILTSQRMKRCEFDTLVRYDAKSTISDSLVFLSASSIGRDLENILGRGKKS